jgi:hypothetical protein
MNIKRGHTKRGPCEECGDPNTEGHHVSYSADIVRFLCSACHGKLHYT